MTAESVKEQLLSFGNPQKAEHSKYFFKTGKSQYGEGDRSVAYQPASSKDPWEQRIAVVISTLAFIRKRDFADTLQLAEKFLAHRHDLMHEACGWMLREAGKRSEKTLTGFLDAHYTEMPRTMLRYAIEKLSPGQKKNT